MSRVQEGQYQVTWDGFQHVDTICCYLRAVPKDKGYQTPADCAGVDEHPKSQANILSTLNIVSMLHDRKKKGTHTVYMLGCSHRTSTQVHHNSWEPCAYDNSSVIHHQHPLGGCSLAQSYYRIQEVNG